jgi:hypothetical protein
MPRRLRHALSRLRFIGRRSWAAAIAQQGGDVFHCVRHWIWARAGIFLWIGVGISDGFHRGDRTPPLGAPSRSLFAGVGGFFQRDTRPGFCDRALSYRRPAIRRGLWDIDHDWAGSGLFTRHAPGIELRGFASSPAHAAAIPGNCGRTLGYGAVAVVCGIFAQQLEHPWWFALRVGLVTGIVTGVGVAINPYIEYYADHLPKRTLGALGIALIFFGFVLQSVQYWVALLDVRIT